MTQALLHATRSLHSGFQRSVERFPNRPAVEVAGQTLSYRTLNELSAAVARSLEENAPGGGPPLTAVFASRSASAFTGVLSALFRGHGYVPLNPKFPTARTRFMLEQAGCRAIVVGREASEQLEEILEGVEEPLLLVFPEQADVRSLRRRWPQHTVIGSTDLEDRDFQPRADVSRDALAYLLFTSGSTGAPKGVMVAHRNVTAFVDAMVERYGITEDDRFS